MGGLLKTFFSQVQSWHRSRHFPLWIKLASWRNKPLILDRFQQAVNLPPVMPQPVSAKTRRNNYKVVLLHTSRYL
jgi:hypothetical protein